ncbi:hypothetical protein LTR56_009815 [Elasticomyces elasticus]|nr:hypothetical protein LTR56_009815 [Elasticomyces elasticus]KAK3659130.1 hypothetical protein LTR22_008593 [Elasticomyces elasticus]KAK4923192.1 hypothetical protein LTR49_009660 [Elasticomyces elasticus]KAK5761576.1 hypothetical protein LTS12_008368 [Elasticomyces elasticus]
MAPLKPLRRLCAAVVLVAFTFTFICASTFLQRSRGFEIAQAQPTGLPPGTRLGGTCSPFSAGVMSDVTIVLKIGAGEAIERRSRYVTRLQSCKPDLLIFSDRQDKQNGFEIIDVLANVQPGLKLNNPDFDIYDRIQETDTTDGRSEEGWRLDKYKFLPMMEWTSYMRPKSQWFVFVELDTYVNYDNLYRFLSTFDPTAAHYFGSPVWPKKKPAFAHGGSGFVLSRGAMDKLIGLGRKYGDDSHTPGTHFFGQDAEKFCCGDEVLARVLKQSGVSLRGYWPMFNGEKPSTISFGKGHWCEAVISLHHLSDHDFAELAEWESLRTHSGLPLTFEELFTMIEPQLYVDSYDWTNMSEDVVCKRDTVNDCGEACFKDSKCMQFEYMGAAGFANADFELDGGSN